MIFTSKRNPRRVFETIYSIEFDSSSNPNVVMRSTHDPIYSPNAAPRSTHVSAKQQPMLLESTHDPTTNLGCSDTTCCA